MWWALTSPCPAERNWGRRKRETSEGMRWLDRITIVNMNLTFLSNSGIWWETGRPGRSTYMGSQKRWTQLGKIRQQQRNNFSLCLTILNLRACFSPLNSGWNTVTLLVFLGSFGLRIPLALHQSPAQRQITNSSDSNNVWFSFLKVQFILLKDKSALQNFTVFC